MNLSALYCFNHSHKLRSVKIRTRKNIIYAKYRKAKKSPAFYEAHRAEIALYESARDALREISGGEKQRTAVARALINTPLLILADEPTGNLDSRTSQDVLSLMKVTGRKFSQTMVMITHNEEIAQLSDRIVRIEDGRIVTR